MQCWVCGLDSELPKELHVVLLKKESHYVLYCTILVIILQNRIHIYLLNWGHSYFSSENIFFHKMNPPFWFTQSE